MKNIAAIALMFFLSSCDSLTTVIVDVESETTVQKSSLFNTFTALGFENFVSFDVSSSQEFENNNASKNNIGESYLTGFTLEVTDPDGQTLEFISSMKVYISDGESDTKIEIARIEDGTNTDVRLLYLDVFADSEIGKYLRAEKTKITVEAQGEPPQENTTIEAVATFKIKLKL
ncbi:hypothetical protein ACFOND_06060 [Reinekea marina]|uniref:Lipoprotein n=2 Tax=Reinekea marina TaxID=1310421 RepID=A0ABV7WSZ8_9GAMM